MTQDQVRQLSELISKVAVPNLEKLDLRMQSLVRMRDFYDEKAGIAPDRQAFLFNRFVEALEYSMATLVAHRNLVVNLTEIVSEVSDENRTSS